MKKVKVRFAPSPTGGLHMGGIRTALYNYLFAKKHGGEFLIRLEDTDSTRFVPEAEKYIIEALEWCGIQPFGANVEQVIACDPEGENVHISWKQSLRKDIYIEQAVKLIESGHAYFAFDTQEELTVLGEAYNFKNRMRMKNSLTMSKEIVTEMLLLKTPHVIRLKVEPGITIVFEDLIRGKISVDSSNLDDKVLIKSDGMATYHLAHIVDDIAMKITHVLRGEEWLPSAPAHLLIYKAMGVEPPIFAHLNLILDKNGKKFSKRAASEIPMYPFEWYDKKNELHCIGYREMGYHPSALLNTLALLGWSPGGNKEIMTLDEMVDLFDLKRAQKSGSKFDTDKARWINMQHMRNGDDKFMHDMAVSFDTLILIKKSVGDYPTNNMNRFEYIKQVCILSKEKVGLVNEELWDLTWFFFVEPDKSYFKSEWVNPGRVEFMKTYIEKLESTPDAFDSHDKLQELYKDVCAIHSGEAMKILRPFVTGSNKGPKMFDTMFLLGRERVMNRMKMFFSMAEVHINENYA